MKRTIVLVVQATVLAGIVFGDPALGGGRGLFRVQDARVEEDGALVFANRWMVRRIYPGPDAINYRGPLYGLEMNYAPFPFIEMFGSLIGVLDIGTSPWSTYYDWQGHLLGAKLSVPWLPVVKLAASGHLVGEKAEYTFKESSGFLDGLRPAGNSWRAIASLRFWELYKTLPTLMFNYGRTFDGSSAFAGTGIEMASNAVDLFIEASSEAPVSAGFTGLVGKDCTPKARITPGARIKMGVFHLNGGVEIGLTDSVPDYEAILGITFVSPFPKPPPRPWGRLAGKVQDARTGLPLAAVVSLSGARGGRVSTDPRTGVFFMQRAPVGVIVAEASAEGYIPEAVPLVVTDKGFATYTFNLKPLVPYGTVAGRIYDKYSGKPLEAAVSFVGTELPAVTSNALTGFFRSDRVPAGFVQIKVEKEGYFPEEQVLEVEDGEVTKLEVALAPLDMKGYFAGKVVDKKTGAGVAATISFVSVKRPALGNNPQTGEFLSELPAGSYEVKVEAEGYLPQTSTFEVSKAETTYRVYELVSRGMVITLKGVYFEFGKATLRTESYPALMEAAQILKDNPDIRVEIQGHTCNIGSDKANQLLSEKRAYAVMNFLVQYGGINPQRLTAKGYRLERHRRRTPVEPPR
ncbi:MAG: OmpA family protein [candidate division WOR-3 bacterium]